MTDTEDRIPSDGLLNKIIEILIEERFLSASCNRAGGSTTEHDMLDKNLISLSEDIRRKMGSEQNIFMQYEELSTLNENSLLRDAYKQGFIDGAKLIKEILLEAK